MTSYYPVFLDLKGRSCVVIGGGLIAEGKIKSLIEHDCSITVISPEATSAIRKWANQDKITWHERVYQEGDLKGAFVAIAATNITEVNRVIAQEAESKKVLLNVVDYPPLCTFIAPSVVKRGQVTFAISTGGASPALARKLRETLEESDLLDYAELAPLLSKARSEVKTRGLQVPPDRWQQYITTDLIDMVRKGREVEALELLLSGLATAEEAP
ncbi:MAG: bifunctional precorrin-2 dehydrogenase/sirohydrochlorin ferrochelatase [Chloroflexi bacterium]|nr:bifunctional precorrin-2 dehydrogenase/sirohydrochlorin ferrochelatase [Chloroflexota bacterium]